MITKTRWFPSRRASAAAAVLCASLLAGCASIEHVRLYRDAREDFSAAANADNLAVLGAVFPDASTLQRDVTSFANIAGTKALASSQQAQASFDRWNNVANLFIALNRRAASELKQDDLYGSSRVLELVARSQRAAYAHALAATTGNTAGATGAAPAPEPLSAPVAEAEALLKDETVKLFARDAYLARSLKGESRYKIAFVRAVQASGSGKLDAARVREIATEMARAEAEVAAATKGAGEAVEQQAALSRLVMLVSARYLVTDVGNIRLPEPQPAADLDELHQRVESYWRGAKDKEAAEYRLLHLVHGKPADDADLAGIGLGRIREAP